MTIHRLLRFMPILVMISCSSDVTDSWNDPSDKIALSSGIGQVNAQTRGDGSIDILEDDLLVSFIRLDQTGTDYPVNYSNVEILQANIHATDYRVNFETDQFYNADNGKTRFIGWYPAGTWNATAGTVTFPVLDGTTDILASQAVDGSRDNRFTKDQNAVKFSHQLTRIRVFAKLYKTEYQSLWGKITKVVLPGKAQSCTLTMPATNANAGALPTATFNAAPVGDLLLQKLDNSGEVTDVTLSGDTSETPIGYAIFAPHTASTDQLTLKVFTEKAGVQEVVIPYASMALGAGESYDVHLEFLPTRINSYATISQWEESATFTYGTPANCYILKPGGNTVAIPVSRANEFAQQLGEDEEFTASMLWSDGDTDLISLSQSGKGYKDYIHVTSGASNKTGNAVVVLKNKSNKVLWSWHIWVIDYNPQNNKWPATGGSDNTHKTFMDRNLGATGNTLTTNSRGLFYQWGRKDPFPATNNIAGVSFASSGAVSIASAIENPGKFYSNNSTPNDWLSTPDAYLWNRTDNKKTIYDPCPAGWRVPTSGEDEASPWYGLQSNGFITSGDACGAKWGDNALWPAAGYRDGTARGTLGELNTVNSKGYYWSATATTDSNAFGLVFENGSITPSHKSNRANGMSVRCVAE